MFRKIINRTTISLIAICLLIMPLAVIKTFADDTNTALGLTKTTQHVGELVNDSGTVKMIPGRYVSSNYDSESNLYSDSYEYLLTVEDLSQSNTAHDGSYAVKATVTIYYNKKSGAYCLKKVKVSWTRLSKGVQVTSAKLTYGCSSATEATTQTGSKTITTSGTVVSTGFTKYIHNVNYAGCGAHAKINLYQAGAGSTRTWSFTVKSYLFGNIE